MILTGIKGLLRSTKGTLCLIFAVLAWQILICTTYVVLKGVIDGTAYAAVMGTIAAILTTISGVYMWTRSRANLAKIEKKA